MTVIVDKNISRIVISRSTSGTEEKTFHVAPDVDIILIGIEEINKGEES